MRADSSRRRTAPLVHALLLAAALGAGFRARAEPPPAEEKLSPDDRANRVEHALDQMHQQTAAMEKIGVRARAEKDIVRLNCVNARINQAKGLVRVCEQSAVDLREANARSDADTSEKLFIKTNIAAKKVTQLRQEAEQCVGQLAYYTDDKTHVDVEVPPGLPSSDPTWVALPTPVDNRPAPASGF